MPTQKQLGFFNWRFAMLPLGGNEAIYYKVQNILKSQMGRCTPTEGYSMNLE